MIIITKYTLVYNEELECFYVVSNEQDSICPECKGKLQYRDSRVRIWKFYGGKVRHLIIRRMKCNVCGRIHNELPDCSVPYKHYGNEVIENVLDEVSTPEDASSEDYPCERTMKRWKYWLAENLHRVEGTLRSVGTTLLGFGDQLLKSKVSLLTELRKSGGDWLKVILRFIYNSGYRLCT